MTTAVGKRELWGMGGAEAALDRASLRSIVADSLSAIPAGSRILAIVPDKTRDDITSILLPMAIEELTAKAPTSFEVLIAQGTHPAMTPAEKDAKTARADWAGWARSVNVLDHRWNDPAELIVLGEIGSETVSQLTGGLFIDSVRVSVNRRLSPANCDYVLIFGAVLPHEVAGFAGGAKYLFPGVSGPELTNTTHWIGALSGIENVIGRVETPARHLIETASDMIPARIVCFSAVVSRDETVSLKTHALFAGGVRESFRAAAAVSEKVHIKRTGRKYSRVVAILDDHYDELWTGGKASYKLGGVIEDGGDLIIYAPRINTFSQTHGKTIERHKYMPIEEVTKMVAVSADLRENLCVAAHLAHVAYGSKQNGQPRFRITLASQIDRSRCENVNLGYLDPNEFRLEDFESHEDTLVVKHAGRDLYLV